MIEAGDGKEAMAKLLSEGADFLITDWNMPEMNGLELSRWVRSAPQLAAMPILMVTTRGNKEDVIEAMKVRVSNYIVKPFTAQGLKDKIDAIMKTVDMKPA
jgi:two-component system chemotaxis response regulator CheY